MPLPTPELAALFPAEGFAFRLTLERKDVPDFFRAADPTALLERQRLLHDFFRRHAALEKSAIEPLREFATLVRPELGTTIDPAASPEAVLRSLGGDLEPDFLFLCRDDQGVFRLRGGALCFPSFWDLGEKLNHTLAEIHGPVPGLNHALAPALDRFLERLKPSQAFSRSNWGLAATPALNLHPHAGAPRLGSTLDVAHTWLRVEKQILFVLPETAAVVFGIRIQLEPLARILRESELRAGFHRTLASMPEAMVAYKGFAALRPALLAASS